MRERISRRRAAKLIGATVAGSFLPSRTALLFATDESSRKILRSIASTSEKLPVIGRGSARRFDVRSGSLQARTVGDVLANMGAGVGRLPDAKMRERMASLFVGF